MSDSSLDRDPFELIAESFLAQYRTGKRPSIADYAGRYPALAEKIHRLLPALVAVEEDLSLDVDATPTARNAPGWQPKQLGDYRILREVGRGGMGVVYEAEQISLGRRVALKVLPHQIARDREALERFRREAKAAARLHHTNIVPVFEVGQDGDTAYYAMQFIQGQGLDQIIEELARQRGLGRHDARGRPERTDAATTAPAEFAIGRVARLLVTGRLAPDRDVPPAADRTTTQDTPSPSEWPGPDATLPMAPTACARRDDVPDTARSTKSAAVLPGGAEIATTALSGRRPPFFRSVAQIGRQVAQGLAYAHARGIIHRDTKPSNLLLDQTGVVWIADFGLAKADDEGLTATGDILGTVRYMAPERFRGEGDARADIYALGLTLYELATLRPAYHSADPLRLIEQIKSQEPARPRSLDDRIPRDLETIILKAIEKDPARRYPTAEAMAEDLRRFLNDETIQARPASPAERYARWARRHPGIATLGAVLAAVLVLSTVASLIVAKRMSELAVKEKKSAIAERNASKAAVAETYRAMLSEAKALRAGHEPGWRDEALAVLARLATTDTARRDLPGLRTEAAATLATPDIGPTARIELPRKELGSFAFSRDGRTIVTAGRETGLEFWDVRGNRHVSSAPGLTVGNSYADKVVSLPDRRGLIVGTVDRGVVFTDLRGQLASRPAITRGASRPTKLAIDAQARRIAIAWTDGVGVTVHDVASGALLSRFSDSPFALSPDGRWLAREEDSEIVLRPIDPGGERVVLGRHREANVFDFSPDGSILAVGFADHTAVLWDIARREQFGTLRGHRERVLDVAFSPDGDWIATASLDYTTRIWETRTGQNLAALPTAAVTRRVAWAPTGDLLAASTDTAQEVYLYAITGRRDVQQWLRGHRYELNCVAAHPLRDRLVSSGYQELTAWDLSNAPTAPAPMPPHPGAVNAVAFSPDGSLLATASWAPPAFHEVLIRDGATGVVRSRIPGLQVVGALAFDRTGRRLAFCGNAGAVVVWDLDTNSASRQFSIGSEARAVGFLDRGNRLVTHGQLSVILFDVESGARKESVDLGHGTIRTFRMDHARGRLIAGFADGTIGSVTLPDLSPGRSLERAHEGGVECLALSPDGRLLATAGADHRIALRDADSFEVLLHLPTWAGNVRDLSFNFDGTRLAVVGTNSDVDLWDLSELSRGLAALHLAWDRPAPSSNNAEDRAIPLRRANIALIRRPGAPDPAVLKRAQALLQSGIGAYEGGRWADAIRDLEQARDRFRSVLKSADDDALIKGQLGVCLASLGGAYRRAHRVSTALDSLGVARDVLEAIREPSSMDLYNLACAYAGLSDVASPGNTSSRPAERQALADRAMDSLRRSLAKGMSDFALMDRDHDLDPLRGRPDFRALVLDRGFPRDPFARPSPLATYGVADPFATAEWLALSADIARRPSDWVAFDARGRYLARHREWRRAHADFGEALRLHAPETWTDQNGDTRFGFQAGLVALEAGDPGAHRRIARAMLQRFAGSDNPFARDRTAKLNLFAGTPAGDGERILELADRDVRIGEGGPNRAWLQLTLGMASYRTGDLDSTLTWLRRAEGSGLDDLSRAVARFYLAMAEHRLGHPAQAASLFRQAAQTADAAARPGDWAGLWFSVAETDLSRREAESLIFGTRGGSTGRGR